MAGSAIGIRMGYGYPGNYARTPDDITVGRLVKASTANIPFGACVALNSDNSVQLAGTGFTAAKFGGIAVRRIKTPTVFTAQNVGGEYAPGEVCDALTRGAVTVKCNVGTPTAGGDVYVRISANTNIPAGVVGGFEAAADSDDSSKTVKLPNVKWTTGAMDANRICEVTIIERVNP